MLAALALGAGIAVQPLGRRLQDAAVVRGTADAGVAGLALVTLGLLAASAATAHPGVAAATGTALLLGASFGLCILSGLREVEDLALAGLALPYLLALAVPLLGYRAALLLAAPASTLTILWLAQQGRRYPAPRRRRT